MDTGNWKVLREEMLVNRDPWIRLSEQDVLLPNGAHIDGYILWEEREYALVVASTKDGIPLMRQYKHGLGTFSLDLPGGYLNKNEEALAAAKRELIEETGFTADEWIHLSSLILDNNRGKTRAHLFLAIDVHKASDPSPDETEELSMSFYGRHQLITMLHDGSISSLPTVAALLLALQYLGDIS